MPVGALQTIGDFSKPASFRHANDRKLLTNPTYVEKIKTAFSRTSFLFDLYFVNKPGLSGQGYLEKGLVSPQFVFAKHGAKDKSGDTHDAPFLPFHQGSPHRDSSVGQPPYGEVGRGLGLDHKTFKLNPEAITVFFTNNSGDERMPMTAWIIGHRVGHAMRRLSAYQQMTAYLEKAFDKLAVCYGIGTSNEYSRSYGGYGGYEPERQLSKEKGLTYLAQEVCTMRSARDRNIRNFGEVSHELFAQYLLDGRVAFNPAPRAVPVAYSWGRPQMRSCKDPNRAQAVLDDLSANFDAHAENILWEAEGKCFVM